jgi:hypothetical protein
VITALGSVWVGGVEYDTSSSSVSVDGTAGAPADLKVGMNITFAAATDPATGKAVAQTVDYESSVKGPVDANSINTANGTFTVLGTTIQTGTLTVFEGTTDLTTLATLASPFVEVSGPADPTTKVINADRVEVKTGTALASEKAKVGGKVTAIDTTALTVTLTGEEGKTFVVTYTGTLDPSVKVGAPVRVKLTSTSPLVAAAADIVVRQGEVKDQVKKGDHQEAEGIAANVATAGTDPMTFTLGNQNVSVTAAILGTQAANLTNGSRVHVEGTLDSSTPPVLVASQIEVKKTEQELKKEGKSAFSSAQGTAKSFDVTSTPHTLTVTVGKTDMVFQITDQTQFRGVLTGTDPLAKLNVGTDTVNVVYTTDSTVTPAVYTAVKVGVEGAEGDLPDPAKNPRTDHPDGHHQGSPSPSPSPAPAS